MAKLPDLGGRQTGRLGDLALASLVGVAVAGLTLMASTGSFDRSVPDAMAELSVPEAYGRNIVNVILVDFRALDTFGEIVVVGVAALVAVTLIRLRSPRGDAR
jgi:multicomponent Na+:H+ antiporter subunit A